MQSIASAYNKACELKGWLPLSSTILGKILQKLFPNACAITKRDKEKKTHARYYKNIVLAQTLTLYNSVLLHEIRDEELLPGSYIMSKTINYLKLGVESNVIVNGNRLMAELELSTDSYAIKIRGKSIDHSLLSLDNGFQPCIENIKTLVNLTKQIPVCCGVQNDSEVLPSNCVREVISHIGDENSNRISIRCFEKCEQVLKWTAGSLSCRQCQKAVWEVKRVGNIVQGNSEYNDVSDADNRSHTEVISKTENECEIYLDDSSTDDLKPMLKYAFPHASKEMQVLLESQQSAMGKKDKRGHRWHPDVIRICINQWIRSPKNYDDLKDSNMLILPSGRQLRRYKNAIKQQPGINYEMLSWMRSSADNANVPIPGRTGVLMHDECKIQQDLVLERNGDTHKLIGWVDMGEEAHLTHMLRTQKISRELATDVLQITFLGHTGFRFPVAHFAGKCAKAHELFIILWNVISALGEYGFHIDSILQDGGQQNREFMNMMFPDGDPLKHQCCAVNIVNLDDDIVISQDFSHCVKKIRNSLYSSGADTDKHYTRHMRFESCTIEWKQWVAAVKWDRDTNSRLIHRKVTDAHLYPNQSEKMRNNLAEEMLDHDMLNLMEAYRSSLKNGTQLNKSIELLQNTSVLIKIFRDHRPILNASDERLENLQSVLHWFQSWEDNIMQNIDIDKKIKSSCLMTSECRQDIKFLLVSFMKVCEKRLKKFPGWGMIPSRFNTDLVENHFCQERGLHNGNMTHPNLATYSRTVNSIIIGQSSKSRAKKGNAGMPRALPYTMSKPKNPKMLRL